MIALSTGSLYTYSIDRVFRLAAETGYDGIEVLVDGRWDSRDSSYLSRLCSKYNLPITALHSPFVNDVQGWPLDQLGRLKWTVALAQELDVGLVVTHLPFRFRWIVGQVHFFGLRRILLPVPLVRRGPYYYFVRDGRLRELETSSRVTIAVENMPARRLLGMTVNTYWFNCPEELDRFHHLTLDTTHWGTWGRNPVEIYEQLKERVVHIHLSNFDGLEHRSPPDGRLLLPSLLGRLAQDKYKGAISVESAPDALDADDEDRCRLALKRALSFCRKHFVSTCQLEN